MRRAVGRALALVPGAPLLLVGGKGGTGKTTLALHIALSRAAAAPGRRVLLAAVGGGVGLSSALGVELGDAPRPVPDVPNLFAAEVDARARFDRLKAEVRADLARALEKLLGGGSPAAGFDLRYDRAVIEGLLDLAPPGVDEIAGLALLLDEARGFEDIVLDCAPTGHLVRFLEMPRKAREWLALAARLLTRYPELGGAAAVERTISLLRGVRAVAERLADPARTALVVVTLPERLPAAEAAALRNRAAAAGTAPALVIVNRVEPETRCPRCAARREAGLAAARALAAEVAPIPVALVPEAAFAEAA
jgi:arsenite-transporting ATPase